MAVAMTLQQYLTNNGVAYDTLTHPEAPSAARAAELSHVSGDCVAKAVILKMDDGYLLAVVPASHHLRMGELRRWLQEPVGLAAEQELKDLFPDCDVGAIPALGTAYGLMMLVDESLEGQPDIYFEGGDHRTLVHVSGAQFHELTRDAQHGCFSAHD